MKKIIVFLESEEYGYEEFKADNLQDALDLIRRLYQSSKKHFKDDHVERKIGIKIGGKKQ